jgi:hypothetical protein
VVLIGQTTESQITGKQDYDLLAFEMGSNGLCDLINVVQRGT